MKTASIRYEGNLRTQATHLRSGREIITDAPVDNHGKGEAFSPTDLLATAVVSCMITVMGIQAGKRGLEMGEVRGEVEKIMVSGPRRVGTLNVDLTLEGQQLSPDDRQFLEDIALNCPVALSLNEQIGVNVQFNYR